MAIIDEILCKIAPVAESAWVRLVLELLNSKVDHPDFQCDHVVWGMKVIDMVASPNVKLLYDIYHMQIMEGDLVRTIQNHHAYFGHYHTAGNPGRNEMDYSQEIYYPSVFRAIRETGYTGFVATSYCLGVMLELHLNRLLKFIRKVFCENHCFASSKPGKQMRGFGCETLVKFLSIVIVLSRHMSELKV